jgi:eukaryotic-like serine/threonine-protein kinase
MIGRILGNFEITVQIGKGGMGEIYQAKDRKLGRDVAIKVLPEEFSKDIDRIGRFQREAKVLASLNHPNIAAIYGLEESGGIQFLVLELVEGETLADQLKRGPIPVDESLKLALQIAEALEAAHEKGVIHRDLKPANIKVTPDGKVKVLDFGLAKAFAGEPENIDLSNSPTLSNAATRQGIILGTAAYMSPEQAKGKSVDKRTDIWAFGCVLFEMLTGQAAFQGEDITEILASVVKGGANLDLLPANLHPRVREVIVRCLQKDLRRRYSGISDAKYEIEQALADPRGVLAHSLAAGQSQSNLRLILPWVAAAVVITAILAGVAVWKLQPPPQVEPRSVVRFSYELPQGQQLGISYLPVLAVTPDGKNVAFVTSKGLFLRSIGGVDPKLISGPDDGPSNPFFSPDGQWLGYWSIAENRLKKIALNGGPPFPLCDTGTSGSVAGVSWGADNTIIWCAADKGIMRTSADGGTPEKLIGEKGETYFHPRILPDGKSLLFTLGTDQGYKIAVQSLTKKDRKVLFAGDCAWYLSAGYLVYALENNLFAV